MDRTSVTKKPETNQLVFERTFGASKQRLFDAFKSVDALTAWWGPRGWETESKEFNFTAGGRWHYGMKCMDEAQTDWYGLTSWGLMLFETIDEPDNFTYTDYFSDENGDVDDTKPPSSNVMRFDEAEDGTKLTVTTTYPSREAYEEVIAMGVIEGFSQTWDRLEVYVIE